ncbi:MAG: DsrE family protein [Gammaproteobacteria bacterium]
MHHLTIRFVPAFIAALALATLATATWAKPAHGYWVTPAVPGYGAIHVWTHEVSQPSPHATYKAVFYIPQPIAKKSKINPELGRVARMLNIFTAYGVPLQHLHFVVVVDGGSIPTILDNRAYQDHFHRPNPNAKLVALLAKDGVTLRVCGVALAGWGFDPKEVLRGVGIAPTGPSTLILYENRGYALVPF